MKTGTIPCPIKLRTANGAIIFGQDTITDEDRIRLSQILERCIVVEDDPSLIKEADRIAQRTPNPFRDKANG